MPYIYNTIYIYIHDVPFICLLYTCVVFLLNQWIDLNLHITKISTLHKSIQKTDFKCQHNNNMVFSWTLSWVNIPCIKKTFYSHALELVTVGAKLSPTRSWISLFLRWLAISGSFEK